MLGLRPERDALIDTAVTPEPTDWAVVLEYELRVLLVPHSNHAVVADPFGLTEPFAVAEFDVTLVAAEVVAVGGTALVVKLSMLSRCVPPAFWAATRK